jgi:mono/diheme cytochrome c family protein
LEPGRSGAYSDTLVFIDSIAVKDTVRLDSVVLRVDTTVFLDTVRLVLKRDSVFDLIADAHGIWRDFATTGFDFEWDTLTRPPEFSVRVSFGQPFVDIPPAYRPFWRHCSNCHSDLGSNTLAPKARKALLLNTWEQIAAYGPERLVFAARGGGMPPKPTPPVPEDVLGRAQAYLASWPNPDPGVLLVGFRYRESEDFVRKYCADCHAPGGTHPEQRRAMLHLVLDTYGQWHKHRRNIRERIGIKFDSTQDTSWISQIIMPPDSLPAGRKPSDAERLKMMEWIDRFAPNTVDGSGIGDSVSTKGIVTSGAVQGLVYEPAAKIVNRYCADCHTVGGLNPEQPDAWNYAIRLDTYALWDSYPTYILEEHLDPVLAAQKSLTLMPPEHFPLQPTSGERQLLLDWLRRGSPNTVDGR